MTFTTLLSKGQGSAGTSVNAGCASATAVANRAQLAIAVNATTGTATTRNTTGNVVMTFTDYGQPACGPTKLIAREWRATDGSNRSLTGFQYIPVLDTTAPELTVPADVVLDCPADTSTTSFERQ